MGCDEVRFRLRTTRLLGGGVDMNRASPLGCTSDEKVETMPAREQGDLHAIGLPIADGNRWQRLAIDHRFEGNINRVLRT